MIVIDRHWKFVLEYCKDFNATQAYLRVYGCDEPSAATGGSRLLQSVEIQGAIRERQEDLAAAAKLTPEWVLKQWMQIAEADPNEIIDLRKIACVVCYADGRADLYRTLGFDLMRDPCPECPTCQGEGTERIVARDTRKLTGSAKRLYAGVKQTANGIEIKMRDQDAAAHHLANYLGMTKTRTEISGPGGAPIRSESITTVVRELTDAELEEIAARGLVEG